MSDVALTLDGSSGHHNQSVYIPLSTVDGLQIYARSKLLPLKQNKILQRPRSYRDHVMLLLNHIVFRQREQLRDFMLLRDLVRRQRELTTSPFLPLFGSARPLATTLSLTQYQSFWQQSAARDIPSSSPISANPWQCTAAPLLSIFLQFHSRLW